MVMSQDDDPHSGTTLINPDGGQPSYLIGISSLWKYSGTPASNMIDHNCSRAVPDRFIWPADERYLHPTVKAGSKRPSDVDTVNETAPPAKVHINEEKVARQFFNMSLNCAAACQELSDPCLSMQSAWQKYYSLEEKLELGDEDEGVDMGADIEQSSPGQANKSLHFAPSLKLTLVEPIPQSLVPRPICREVMLWQPPDLVATQASLCNHSSKPVAERSPSPKSDGGHAEPRKILSRKSRLAVPQQRADTPPPNARTAAIPEGMIVRMAHDDDSMDFLDING